MQTVLALVGVIIGGLMATLIPHVLADRTARRQELRDIRLALLETRDLVWNGARAVESHVAKLRVRAASLGINRDVFSPLLEAHGEVKANTTYEYDGDNDETPSESMVVRGPSLGYFDVALEDLERVLASHRVGRRL